MSSCHSLECNFHRQNQAVKTKLAVIHTAHHDEAASLDVLFGNVE